MIDYIGHYRQCHDGQIPEERNIFNLGPWI